MKSSLGRATGWQRYRLRRVPVKGSQDCIEYSRRERGGWMDAVDSFWHGSQ